MQMVDSVMCNRSAKLLGHILRQRAMYSASALFCSQEPKLINSSRMIPQNRPIRSNPNLYQRDDVGVVSGGNFHLITL